MSLVPRSMCVPEKYGLTEEEAARARIEFIQAFPALASLMYSIPIAGRQPANVDEWLEVIKHEVNHAFAKRKRDGYKTKES